MPPSITAPKGAIFGFDIDPAAIHETATRKSDNLRPCAVDNREFQITVEGCGVYRLPIHDG